LPFEEARAYVHSLGLQSKLEWHDWCKQGKRPANVPCNPERVYKLSGEWAGTPRRAAPRRRAAGRRAGTANPRTAEPACERRVQELDHGARSRTSAERSRRRRDVARACFRDWLGFPERCALFLPFEEARAIVRTLGLQNEQEWERYCKTGKRPSSISYRRPEQVYTTGYPCKWAGAPQALQFIMSH